MATISTFKEYLDLLLIYGEEIYKRDLNEELKQIYSKSINKAIYTVKQWESHHSRDEILDELKTRYN